MKKLLVASMVCMFSALPALADTPPALLGELDPNHIQKIENTEDVRGKYLANYASYVRFCGLSWNRCLIGVHDANSDRIYTAYRTWTVREGWSNTRHRKH